MSKPYAENVIPLAAGRPGDPSGDHQRGSKAPEVSWEQLDRQDWHLWALAVVLIGVLGTSLVGFMIPSAFWLRPQMGLAAPERVVFGFCVLLALALVYLLERQTTVRRLRRKLIEAQKAIVTAEREALCQSFLALPGLDQFRDALAMEYRRASTSEVSLAAMLYSVPAADTATMGRLTSILRHMIRRNEALYRIGDTAVGIILPGMQLGDVLSFAAQAQKFVGLPEDQQEVTSTAFPDSAASLAELEERLSTATIRLHKYALEGIAASQRGSEA